LNRDRASITHTEVGTLSMVRGEFDTPAWQNP